MKLTKERMAKELFYRINNDLSMEFQTGLEIAAEFYEAMNKIEEFQKTLQSFASGKYKGLVSSRIELEGEHITDIPISLIVNDFDIYMDEQFSMAAGKLTEQIRKEYGFDFSVIYERINLSEA